MKVIVPGHIYELKHFEDNTDFQSLSFIHKEKNGDEFKTIQDGTTNEEVLEVLIDRLKFLNQKLPSRETSIALTKCEEALMWLDHRTVDRVRRRVEGTDKP